MAIFKVVPASERGAAAATTSLFIDLGLGGGPIMVGWIVARLSIPGALGVSAAVAGAAALAVFTAGFKGRKVAPSSPPV